MEYLKRYFLIAMCINCSFAYSFVPPFFQDAPLIYVYQGNSLANWNQVPFNSKVIQVSPIVDPDHELDSPEFYVLTENELWLLSSNSKWVLISTFVPHEGGKLVSTNDKMNFSYVASSGVYECRIQAHIWTSVCDFTKEYLGRINDVKSNKKGDLAIATKTGAYFKAFGKGQPIKKINEIIAEPEVNAVAFDANNNIMAGTSVRLWRKVSEQSWHYFRVPGIIDASITSLHFDSESSLWIGNDICINLQDKTLSLSRVDGYSGLPHPNITSLTSDVSGAVWMGTKKGAIRYLKGEWKYYFGPRWLPVTTNDTMNNAMFVDGSQEVISIAGSQKKQSALIHTNAGLSLIHFDQWTLQKKAEHYQQIIPRHLRMGFVGGVILKKFGDVNSSQTYSHDNDGLWTSCYVVAEAFRYAVTRDPIAKKNAWRSFEAMEFLNNVTGINGLMARSVLPVGQSTSDGVWHNSTVYPGFKWKGDTSSDEVTGHLFAYPIVLDLVAETSLEKNRVRRLINNIVSYIVDNGFVLIDITGKPTTWGRWSPKYLNDDPDWYDERGVNSVQILTFLLSAYKATGDKKFINALNYLVNQHGYGINVINQKITELDDFNYSDDELAFLPYFNFIWANQSLLRNEFFTSIQRAWKIAKPEKSSLWNTIYGAYGFEDFGLKDTIWTLQKWPLSQIEWPVYNQNRTDVILNPMMDRMGEVASLNLLPYDENCMHRWNGNPFTLNGNFGLRESDSVAYLLPYWMARYYKFIQE